MPFFQSRCKRACLSLSFLIAGLFALPPGPSSSQAMEARVFTIQEEHAQLDWMSLRVSPDGTSFAYTVPGEDGSRLMVDGREQAAGEIEGFRFGNNSASYWYLEGTGQEASLVLHHNGKKMPFTGSPNPPVISDDGSRYAIALRREDESFYVIDGEEKEAYDQVFQFQFSRDGSHYAYGAKRGEDYLLVKDGQSVGTFSRLNGFTFSPNGRHFAYAAWKGHEAQLVVDKDILERYDYIGAPAFNPDGKRLAFAAANKVNRHEKKLDMFLVLDGKEIPAPYDQINFISFSPDGRRTAYIARKDGDWYAVIDGQAYGPYGQVGRVSFKSIGGMNRFFFAAQSGERTVIVLDGEEHTFEKGSLGRVTAVCPHPPLVAAVKTSGTTRPTRSDLFVAGEKIDECAAIRNVEFADDCGSVTYLCGRGTEIWKIRKEMPRNR